MNAHEMIKAIADDPEFELAMRRFAMAPAGEPRAHAKQAVLLYLAKKMDEVPL